MIETHYFSYPSGSALLMAGIAFYVGVHHLIFHFQTRRHRENLAFSLLCSLIMLYDCLAFRLYSVGTTGAGSEIQRWQLVTLAGIAIAMLWFVSDFIQRKNRLLDYVFSAYWAAQILILAVDRSDLTLTRQPSIKTLFFLPDVPFEVYEVEVGILVTLQGAMALVALLYVLGSIIRHMKTAPRRETVPITLGLVFVALGAVADTLTVRGDLKILYLLEYAFTGLIFTMSYSLTAVHIDLERSLRRRMDELHQLAAAVHAAGESIVITDATGHILYVNPQFEKMTGYSRDEILEKNPSILKSGVHKPEFYQQLWDTLTRGETWTGNFINRKKDGTLFEERAVISPVRDAEGRIVNFVAVKRDITMERALQNQVRHSQKMSAIGQLAHRVAHNVANKLVIIMGFSKSASDAADGHPEVQRPLANVLQACDEISAMSANLLAFAHPTKPVFKEMGLDRLVRNTHDMVRLTGGPEIGIGFEAHAGDTRVTVDPNQMEQALVHLVMNAVQATPSHGRIRVETRCMTLEAPDVFGFAHVYGNHAQAGVFGVISIRDTGAGMSPATLAHLFEPFFTTRKAEGHPGLGLATVYSIVDQHRGFLLVESEEGVGSTFSIYLPVAPAPPA